MTAASTPLSAKTVVYDGVFTLAGRILKTLLALALSVVVARILGPHGRGIFALATAVYAGLVLSVFTGISMAVSYFMLNAQAGRGVLRPALLTGLIFSVLGALPVIAMAHLAHSNWAILPSVLLLPCNVPVMMVLGYALGTKRIRWQTTYSVLSTGALLVGMCLTFAFFSWDAGEAITAYVVVSAVIAAGSLAVVVWDSRSLPNHAISLRSFALFALRVGVVNLVSLLNYRADLYVVALLATPTVLGEYAVAIAAAESLLVVTQVAAVATSPHVGSMQHDDAARLTAQCVRATFAVALTVCVVFYTVAPYLVRFLYGTAYLPMVPALRVLLIAVMILSIGSALSNFFTLKLGKPEVALISAAAAALMCIGVSWVLVPRVGMIGAAGATVLAYLVGEAVQIAFFMRMTKISIAGLLIPTRGDLNSCAQFCSTMIHDVRSRIAAFR